MTTNLHSYLCLWVFAFQLRTFFFLGHWLIVAWPLFKRIQFCSDQVAKLQKGTFHFYNNYFLLCVPFCHWSVPTAGSFLYSVGCSVLISRYLTSQVVNAAYTNHNADYPCFILDIMWGQQCKRWLQSPASLVAMKQSHTSLCMCKDSLEAFLSPSL